MRLKIFVLEDEIDNYPRKQIVSALNNHDLTIARNAIEAPAIYGKGGYDLLLLDHDMEGFYEDPEVKHKNTGTAFVRWLVTQPLDFKQVVLHSQNPLGRKSMKALLHDAGFSNVDEAPFGPDYVQVLRRI